MEESLESELDILQEVSELDREKLWLRLRQLCKNGRTLESVTGLAV